MNRRRFDELLEIEWARASRANAPIGLLMIDIDDFNAYNDKHGHLSSFTIEMPTQSFSERDYFKAL